MSAVAAGNEEAFTVLDDRLMIPGNPPGEVPLVFSFFPTTEGFYDYENLQYIYQYKDHLGNVRVSFVKDGTELKITDSNDYYPFGLSFLKPTGGVSQYDSLAIPYNYKYNGKELQETGMYDYGARMYMPDIGRWGTVDPLAETTPSWSPYAYGFNNPIRFVDPTGMSNQDWVRLKDGTNIYDSRVTNQSEAETAYGKGSEYRPVGYSYTSTTDGASYQLGDHGFYLKNGSEVGLSPDYADYAGDKSGDILKQGAAFGAGAITLGGGPENPAADVVAVGGLAIFATGALIAKLDYEMSKIKERPDGPSGYQYALTANVSGQYPVYSSGSSAPTGSTHLNAGDVWKFGETTSTGRYTDGYKSSIGTGGVTEVPQVYGNQRQIKMAEKAAIYGYFFQNGTLPPGNKIFR